MIGVGQVVLSQARLLTEFVVGDVQDGNSVKGVCQITPKALLSPVHPSPEGGVIVTPVLAAIICANGRLV